MAELPGAEPDEPQDDPNYKPPEPEDEIPPGYRHVKIMRTFEAFAIAGEPVPASAMAANVGAGAGVGETGAPIELRRIPLRFKVAAYGAAGLWPFAAALLGDDGVHSLSPWLEPLSLASMGGLYASTGLVRALRRELSPENDAPVRKSTLAALFGVFCVLAVCAGVLRGVFINIFGY